MLLGRRPGPVDDRAALVQEPLARLERLLLVEQGARELLNLAPLLCRRFGREPAQRLGDEPLALRLGQSAALRIEASDDALVGGPDLLGGLDLLGPQLRSCASRTAADCAISWSTCWALLPSLARSASISATGARARR